jgi:hypothetical protein
VRALWSVATALGSWFPGLGKLVQEPRARFKVALPASSKFTLTMPITVPGPGNECDEPVIPLPMAV